MANSQVKVMSARELLAMGKSDLPLHEDMKLTLGPMWESQLDRPVRAEFPEGRQGKYREAVFRWNDQED